MYDCTVNKGDYVRSREKLEQALERAMEVSHRYGGKRYGKDKAFIQSTIKEFWVKRKWTELLALAAEMCGVEGPEELRVFLQRPWARKELRELKRKMHGTGNGIVEISEL